MGLLDLIKNKQSSAVQGGQTGLVKQACQIAPVQKNEPSHVTHLPAAARSKAAEKLRFVRAVQAVKRQTGCSEPEAVEYVAFNRTEDFPLLVRGGKNGASALIYNNYRRWKRAIAEAADDSIALALLADDYARGRQPVKDQYVEFFELFGRFYLNLNKLPLAVAYRLTVQKIHRDNLKYEIPSLTQTRYYVKHLDISTIIHAREGEVAFRNMCVDFIRRDWTTIPAGYCVIGDSRTFDTRVRVWDEKTQKWQARRPTVAALIDARSWFFAAYWITTDPVNADTLINTLGLYCCNTDGQPPAVAYFDNGKDYCAQGFSTPFVADGYEHSIFAELGIRLQNATPYNGRAKTVERAFRDMMQNFDKMFPDYLGSTPAGRSAAADWFDDHAEELPSLEQFCTLFDEYISTYHNTPKSGQIHAGKSPAELWAKREVRPAMSPEQLHFAFLRPEAVRTVMRGPAVAFDNTFFYCDTVSVGEKVLVKSDPVNPTHVFLFTPAGALRGEARTREAIKALADDADQEKLKALIARQRKQLADARTTLHRLTGGREQVSPLELMLAPVDAKPQLLGTRTSVKGPSHTFRRLSMPGTITPAPMDFHEDRKTKQLADFEEAITPAAEETSSREALNSFNDFMTSRNSDEDFE